MNIHSNLNFIFSKTNSLIRNHGKSAIKAVAMMCVAATTLFAVSCGDDDPTPGPDKPASRTVLVYMVANNSLGAGGYDSRDLAEMVAAVSKGDNRDGRLLVYHSPSGNGDIELLEITSKGEKTLKTYTATDLSVSSKRMLEVMADVKSLAPAEDYGLVLWSHGSGWLEDGIKDDVPGYENYYSFGDDRGSKMNVSMLASTIKHAPITFSFIYFDCCYMGSIEVLYEMKDCTPVIVASPTELPINGMPYDKNIKHFFSKKPDLAAAAKNTFDYYDGLGGMDRTCTMAVYDMKKIDAVATAAKDFYKSLAVGTLPTKAQPQRFMLDSYCYLYDFGHYVDLLAEENVEYKPEVTEKAKALKDALADALLYSASTPKLWGSMPINHYSGFSSFILKGDYEFRYKNYGNLRWFNDVASFLAKVILSSWPD